MGGTPSKSEKVMNAFMKPPQTPSQIPTQDATQAQNAMPKVDMDFMIQPPDEASIKRPWMQLSNLIDSHVQAFYDGNEKLVYRRESIREDLHEFQIVQNSWEVDELTELLHDARYRKLGLRVCIARVLLLSIDFTGNSETTSLDPDVVALMRRFQQLNPNPTPGGLSCDVPPRFDSHSLTNIPEETAALSTWRIITASFLAPGSRNLTETTLHCEKLLAEFLSVFRSRTDSSEQNELDWRGSIRTIVRQGVDVGEKLFCHPSTWNFDWNGPPLDVGQQGPFATDPSQYAAQIPARTIIIFPALVEFGIQTDGGKRPPASVVQPADVGCGLVFVYGEILPISALSAAIEASQAVPPVSNQDQAGMPAQYRSQSTTTRSRQRDSAHGHSSAAPARDYFSRPPRRSSTIESPQPPGRSGTSRSMENDSHSGSSSGRRRRGRHMA